MGSFGRVLLLLALASPAACRSGGGGPAAEGELLAECPVCKHEGDLACVCVRVTPDTPSCRCDQRTYYFCSEECRASFEQHPERYAPR
jgi:hypothetical protein